MHAAARPMVLVLLTIASVAVGLSSAEAQPPSPRLRLVSPPVAPGAPVHINGLLTSVADVQIAEIQQTIEFPLAQLVFVNARLGIAGSSAGARLAVEMLNASDEPVDDRTRAAKVRVTITAPRTISSGPLVEFEFLATSEREQSIRVRHVAQARDVSGLAVPALAFSDVHVTVTKKTGPVPLKVFGCFFYMH